MTQKRDSRYGLVTAPLLAGVERLWANREQVVNGTLITPVCWFGPDGLDGVVKTWTCRITGAVCSLAGSGSEPDFNVPAPHLSDNALDCNAGKYLQSNESGCGDVSVEDMILLVASRGHSGGGRIVGKLNNSPLQGWLHFQTGSQQYILLYSGGAPGGSVGAPAIGDSYGLSIFTVNRDEASTNGAIHYANGVAGAGVNLSGVGTITCPSHYLQIGAGLGALPYSAPIGLVALYKASDLFSSGATGKNEMDALAKVLTSLFFGTTARHNHASLTPESF